MKKLVFGLMFLSLSAQTFAQDVLFDAKVKKEDVPAVVVSSIEEDFPNFSITDISAIPVDVVENELIVTKDVNPTDNYSTYSVNLNGNNKRLNATYDSNGNLISSYEYLRNVAPPVKVEKAIAKAFPGWTLSKDNYKMSTYRGTKTKDRYKITLTKGNQKMKVYTNPNGKILKVS